MIQRGDHLGQFLMGEALCSAVPPAATDGRDQRAGDQVSSQTHFYWTKRSACHLKTRDAVDAKYTELTSFGYQSRRAPYETSFGMCFALITDPDGNTILLSSDLEANETSKEGWKIQDVSYKAYIIDLEDKSTGPRTGNKRHSL